jgi:phage terminase large subunit-like protein
MAPLGDPGHFFSDVGTKWNDSDAHSMFTSETFEQYKDSSFIVATVRDTEDKLTWPEYTEKQLKIMRSSLEGDFDFFCQFYNQPIAGALEKFDKKWLHWYNRKGDENPVLMAVQKKLDILMTVDPASTVEKRSDYSTCCVQGQSPDGVFRYLLGGFREKIGPEDLPGAIVDQICKWQDVAVEARVSFKFGIEDYSFQTFLKKAVTDELRKRGRSVNVQALKPFRRRKTDRIKVLMTPFMAGRYYIPVRVPCTPAGKGEKAYDLVDVFLQEYERFPTATHDDFLDAMAYGDELMRPAVLPDAPEPERKRAEKDRYFRDLPEDMDDPAETERINRLFGGGPLQKRGKYNYITRKKADRDMPVGLARDADGCRYRRSGAGWR